jgi:hypothetical protein
MLRIVVSSPVDNVVFESGLPDLVNRETGVEVMGNAYVAIVCVMHE